MLIGFILGTFFGFTFGVIVICLMITCGRGGTYDVKEKNKRINN